MNPSLWFEGQQPTLILRSCTAMGGVPGIEAEEEPPAQPHLAADLSWPA